MARNISWTVLAVTVRSCRSSPMAFVTGMPFNFEYGSASYMSALSEIFNGLTGPLFYKRSTPREIKCYQFT